MSRALQREGTASAKELRQKYRSQCSSGKQRARALRAGNSVTVCIFPLTAYRTSPASVPTLTQQ